MQHPDGFISHAYERMEMASKRTRCRVGPADTGYTFEAKHASLGLTSDWWLDASRSCSRSLLLQPWSAQIPSHQAARIAPRRLSHGRYPRSAPKPPRRWQRQPKTAPRRAQIKSAMAGARGRAMHRQPTRGHGKRGTAQQQSYAGNRPGRGEPLVAKLLRLLQECEHFVLVLPKLSQGTRNSFVREAHGDI